MLEQFECAAAFRLDVQDAINKTATAASKQLLKNEIVELIPVLPRRRFMVGRRAQRLLFALPARPCFFVGIAKIIVAHLVTFTHGGRRGVKQTYSYSIEQVLMMMQQPSPAPDFLHSMDSDYRAETTKTTANIAIN